MRESSQRHALARHYDAADVAPRFAFGHGLSYGTAEWGDPRIEVEGRGVSLMIPITATSDRLVTVVVQAYVSAIAPDCVRPPKELKAWDKLSIRPGRTVDAVIELDETAFRRWDTATNGWIVEPGDYDIVLAASATDERQRHRVNIPVNNLA